MIPDWTGRDWSLIEGVVDLFLPAVEVIQMLEADRYPTQSLVLILISILLQSMLICMIVIWLVDLFGLRDLFLLLID